MDNTTRRAIYLRDRSELTPAQERRLRKAETTAIRGPITRASRLRKAMERAARQQARAQARGLMWAIRSGQLRHKVQAEAQTVGTIERLRAALDAQKATTHEAAGIAAVEAEA